MYDLGIVGGGPGGVSGGIYAARKKLKTVLITDFFGGQSLVSTDVQNWIGIKSVSGLDLAKSLEDHLRVQEGLDILDGALVTKIEPAQLQQNKKKYFVLHTNQGQVTQAKTVLITSGSHHRRLNVPGEDKFEGRGVVYCSTCDAPLFKDKIVAVVGGGNSGLEAVLDLIPYATKIYLLQRSERLKGDPVTQEKVIREKKVQILFNVETQEIFGESVVAGLRYRDGKTEIVQELQVQGVFVEIGTIPNSEIVKGMADINERGEIIVDHKTQRTSMVGLWAAGDVTDVLYKQNNISAGDAIKAVLNIYNYLKLGEN